MALSKVALVTGSGKRRVGSYVADALSERGYSLVIHYRSSAAEAEASVAKFRARGLQVVAFQADLGDEQSARRLVDQTIDRFGKLDVLVNCASVWHSKVLEEVTAADVRHNFEVNTLGTFICSQQAGLAMVGQPQGGNIITLGDWADARPYVNYSAYLVSKGAIPALTRVLAVELGSRNPAVRVNCILPGPVMFASDLPEEERTQAIEATLVKHEGKPENVAQAVLFLIENDFVTGTCLAVDGGRTIFGPASVLHD
jgi:pteridine reductase